MLLAIKFTFIQDKMAEKEMKGSAYKILRGICGVTKWTNWHNSKKNQGGFILVNFLMTLLSENGDK